MLPEIAPSFRGRRVLVTGASGFLGARLVSRLAALNAQVLAIGRNRAKLTSLLSPRTDIVALDLADYPEVVRTVRDFGPDVFYHLASAPDAAENFQQIQTSLQSNLALTIHCLDALRALPEALFVYGDSSKVYGDPGCSFHQALPVAPRSSYAIAKATSWEFCQYYQRLYHTRVVSIRPTLIYGPGQGMNLIRHVIESVLEQRPAIRLMGGEQTRDPLYCDDAVDAFVLAGAFPDKAAGQVINIGGGCEIPLYEIAQHILKLLQSDIPIQVDPGQIRPTDAWRSFCDNHEARALLGWQPRHTLTAGLQATLDDIQARFRTVTVA